MVPSSLKPFTELRLDDSEVYDTTHTVEFLCFTEERHTIVMSVEPPALVLVSNDAVSGAEIVVPNCSD